MRVRVREEFGRSGMVGGHGSFCPFLGDLRGVCVLSGIITPPRHLVGLRRRLFSFFMAPRERSEVWFLSSVLGDLRVSELRPKHRSFCPFLGDLRGGWWPSSVMILLDWEPSLRGRLFAFPSAESLGMGYDLGIGGLRISECALKTGRFWPFLGDLRRGWRLSSGKIPTDQKPLLRRLLFAFLGISGLVRACGLGAGHRG